MNNKEIFFKHQAQTTPFPVSLEIDRAEGSFIIDKNGKKYLDMVAGVAVSNLGHNNHNINKAIKNQVDKYLHTMVYGEFIHDEPAGFAQNLTRLLPKKIDSVYFVNSGAEAVEAALKLAKRVTGRTQIISCKKSYHGSTHGALSVSGNEMKKRAFRPLLPDVWFIDHDKHEDLQIITNKTAAVIIEPVQGDAGVRIASKEYLEALREKCDQTGTRLIFDEIQSGFGRTGAWWAFEKAGVNPDYVTLGKAVFGGMPGGAIAAPQEELNAFTHNPMLGHITTFGGHPVVCAAGNAALKEMESTISFDEVEEKGQYLARSLQHENVVEIRQTGLMLAVDLANPEAVQSVFEYCLKNGVIIFWFLSNPHSFRLAPPLNISQPDLKMAIDVLRHAFNQISKT